MKTHKVIITPDLKGNPDLPAPVFQAQWPKRITVRGAASDDDAMAKALSGCGLAPENATARIEKDYAAESDHHPDTA